MHEENSSLAPYFFLKLCLAMTQVCVCEYTVFLVFYSHSRYEHECPCRDSYNRNFSLEQEQILFETFAANYDVIRFIFPHFLEPDVGFV